MAFIWLLCAICASYSVAAFDNYRADNLAVFWGQNSYGGTHPDDTKNFQKRLSFYCKDDTIDVVPIAYLNVFFDAGGEPSIDLANHLPNCQFLAPDIQTCQAKGKLVTLSLAGDQETACFDSDFQASAFADQIWDLFLGGESTIRPFGDAVRDGIDFDIESGSSDHFAAFVNRIREREVGTGKTLLNAVAFDTVYIQFFNNKECALPTYPKRKKWNYDTWDTWALTVAASPDVKLYIGALADPTAAPDGGYVDAGTLAQIVSDTRTQYSSFGSVMLSDASQAYANDRYDIAIKNALVNDDGLRSAAADLAVSPPYGTETPSNFLASTRTKPRPRAWQSDIPYHTGKRVIYEYGNQGLRSSAVTISGKMVVPV